MVFKVIKTFNENFSYFSPIKINLNLHIIGQFKNGYHSLESLVVFKNWGDQIQITSTKSHDKFNVKSKIYKNFPSNFLADNLILKALQLLRERVPHNLPYVKIILSKNIPLSSGIGGGSGNAALALYLLNQFWNLNLDFFDLKKLACRLGSDVPACLHYLFYKRPLYMLSRGEILEPIEKFPEVPILLINPFKTVETKIIFENLDKKKNPPLKKKKQFYQLKNLIDYLKTTRNDLYTTAIQFEKKIEKIIFELQKTKALYCQMSGSGATCFAIYADEEQANDAKKQLKEKYPLWFLEKVTIEKRN